MVAAHSDHQSDQLSRFPREVALSGSRIARRRHGTHFALIADMRVLVALISVMAEAGAAWAHGGSFADGGGAGGYWRRGIPCACAKIECDRCATPALRVGKEIARCTRKVTELARWGDIARLRVVVTFETQRERGWAEGYARLEPAPVFAAFTGSIQRGQDRLIATLRSSEEVRKVYLWERRWFNVDPLLVLRRGPGRVDVRVFPITRTQPVVVTLVGYALVVGVPPGLRVPIDPEPPPPPPSTPARPTRPRETVPRRSEG